MEPIIELPFLGKETVIFPVLTLSSSAPSATSTPDESFDELLSRLSSFDDDARTLNSDSGLSSGGIACPVHLMDPSLQ